MFATHRLWPALIFASVMIAATTQISAEEKRKSTDHKSNEVPKQQRHPLVSRQQIEDALELPCPALKIVGEQPLSDVLEVFEASWSRQLPYDVPFFADLRELDLEGITALQDVIIRHVIVSAGTHTCRDALTLIFERTQDPELSFVPRAGHIEVTTLAKAISDDGNESRVYDVTDLLIGEGTPSGVGNIGKKSRAEAVSEDGQSRPKRSRDAETKKRKAHGDSRDRKTPKTKEPTPQVLKQFGGGGGGMGGGLGGGMGSDGGAGQFTSPVVAPVPPDAMDNILQLIQEQTSPQAKWFMIDGEGGQITVYGQYLVIRQTYQTHREIEALLRKLRAAVAVGGPPRWVQPERQPAPAGGQGGGLGGFGGGGGGGGGGMFSVSDDDSTPMEHVTKAWGIALSLPTYSLWKTGVFRLCLTQRRLAEHACLAPTPTAWVPESAYGR